jgi:hypothetical protein
LETTRLAQAQLSESSVRALLQELLDQVNQKLDPAKIIQFLAPNASITLTNEGLGPPTTFDREQYLQLLQADTPQIKTYTATMQVGQINISGNQAIVKYTSQENAIYSDNINLKSISSGTMTLELQQGQLLITQLTATSKFVEDLPSP